MLFVCKHIITVLVSGIKQQINLELIESDSLILDGKENFVLITMVISLHSVSDNSLNETL